MAVGDHGRVSSATIERLDDPRYWVESISDDRYPLSDDLRSQAAGPGERSTIFASLPWYRPAARSNSARALREFGQLGKQIAADARRVDELIAQGPRAG